MRLYNTYTKKKEIFKPLNGKKATIYTCGPTVYDYAHIGNFRSFIIADILKRYLAYSGYRIKHAKNITDVGHLTQSDIEKGEDKIIAAAQKTGKTPKDIADYFTKSFMEDEKKLNILKANIYPRATKYVKKMIKAVSELIKNGYGYESGGSVFYDTAKFNDYGKLSGNTLKKLKKAARLEPNPLKKNWFDFALWLKAPENHLMKWKSPWSLGYPGWHIECSVMSIDNLGPTIDVHTGGEDNIFPHHENEIAQSEALTGKKFVKIWLHVRHLLVNGKKMSKSESNFYTLRDVIDRGYKNPLSFRLLTLISHYKSQMNFTWEALESANNSLNNLHNLLILIRSSKNHIKNNENDDSIDKLLNKTRESFKEAMDDDLNTPRALAVLFSFITIIGNGSIEIKNNENIAKIIDFISELDSVLGLDLLSATTKVKIKIPAFVKKLQQKREKLRKEKKWLEADKIRDEIGKLGYGVDDTPQGPQIKPIN
ncbi:MAG: cysteine--tRNA ligase [Parcubacteria group bacterium GW2011_GWA2_38_13b]|nr:MAG: cysteine--tRNA ligase [Parcubacteria group bacterium GW2011_GWA2_38_13b]